MSTLRKAVILALCLGVWTACHATADAHAGVVATYDGGEVTTGELDSVVSAVPGERPEKKDIEEARAWGESLVKRYVAGSLVRGRPVNATEAAQIEGLRRKEEVVLLMEAFDTLSENPPEDAAQIDEQDMRAYYREHEDQFRTPGRMSFRHIFFYPGSNPSPADWKGAGKRAGEAYAELEAGKDFLEVARERGELPVPPDKKGAIIQRPLGRLSPELEDYILSATERVPLAPLKTKLGYEIFLLEMVSPPREESYEEARATIRERLQSMRASEYRKSIEKTAEDIPYMLFPEVIDATPGDPTTPILEVGPYVLTWLDFERSFAYDNPDNRTIAVLTDPEKRLEWLRNRVREFQMATYMWARGYLEDPEKKELLETRQEWFVGDYLLHSQAEKTVPNEPTEQDLTDYYETHKEEFALPDAWGGGQLVFRPDLPENATMEDFGKAMQAIFHYVEEAHARAEAGEPLPSLEKEYGGTPGAHVEFSAISADKADRTFRFTLSTKDIAEGAVSGILQLPEGNGYVFYRKGKVERNRYQDYSDCDECGLALKTRWWWDQVLEAKRKLVDEITSRRNLQIDEPSLLRWAITIRPLAGGDIFNPARLYQAETYGATDVAWPLRMACTNLAPTDFRPMGTARDIVLSTTAVWSESGRATDFVAPIHVPDGAVIIAFGVSVEDKLIESPMSGEVAIVSVHSPGGPKGEDIRGTMTTEPAKNMSGQRIHGMGLWIPADNQNEIYQLRVRAPSGDERQKIFCGLVFYLTQDPAGKPLDEGILTRLTDPEYIRACCGGHLPVGKHLEH